jgi:hypothetical protein
MDLTVKLFTNRRLCLNVLSHKGTCAHFGGHFYEHFGGHFGGHFGEHLYGHFYRHFYEHFYRHFYGHFYGHFCRSFANVNAAFRLININVSQDLHLHNHQLPLVNGDYEDVTISNW